MTRVFSSRGVPGMGTRALTGKDSGASGSLGDERRGLATRLLSAKEAQNSLGHLVDESNTVGSLLAESDDTSTAHADARRANRLNSLQTLVVFPRGDDL